MNDNHNPTEAPTGRDPDHARDDESKSRSVRTIGSSLFGGKSLHVANGENRVILGFHLFNDAVMLRPDQARKLASILEWQADMAESELP